MQWWGIPGSKGKGEGIRQHDRDPEDKLRGPPDGFMQGRGQDRFALQEEKRIILLHEKEGIISGFCLGKLRKNR